MKRLAALVLALLLVAACWAAALAMEGKYPWREYTIEVTEIKKNPMLVPSNMGKDEYAVAVYITVDQALWSDDALTQQLYAASKLTDTQGNAYSPSVSMAGTEEPLLIHTYSIPNNVDMKDLTLTFGDGSAEAATPAADAGDGTDTVSVIASDGSTLTLTPLAPGAFREQGDKTIVRTRIGTTVLNNGAQCLPGSKLKLSTIRQSKQYEMLLVAFSYTSTLDADAVADAIGQIGETAALTVEGQVYLPELAWILPDMACLVYDCPETFDSPAHITVSEGMLRIEP